MRKKGLGEMEWGCRGTGSGAFWRRRSLGVALALRGGNAKKATRGTRDRKSGVEGEGICRPAGRRRRVGNKAYGEGVGNGVRSANRWRGYPASSAGEKKNIIRAEIGKMGAKDNA